MTCPHEQLRGRCYHPSLAPWPGNCLDDDTCPGGFGPWGAWRASVAKIAAILDDPVYGEAQAVIDGIGRIRDARLQPYARETALQMAVYALEHDRQIHYHDRCGKLLRAVGWLP